MRDIDTSTDSSPLILVVDDDRAVRSLLSLAMEEEGYRVVEAKDGEQCLIEYKRVKPDMILLDAVMPEMDGFTCCQRLKELSADNYYYLSILMITVLDDSESVEQAFAAGAIDYITKPINWSVLSQRVGRLLAASQSLKAAEEIKQQLKHQQAWEKLWRNLIQKLLQDNFNTVISFLKTELRELWQIEEILIYHAQSPKNSNYLLVKDLSLKVLDLETKLINCYQQGQALVIDNPQHINMIAKAYANVNPLDIQSILITPMLKQHQQLKAILCIYTCVPRPWDKMTAQRFYDLGNLLTLAI